MFDEFHNRCFQILQFTCSTILLNDKKKTKNESKLNSNRKTFNVWFRLYILFQQIYHSYIELVSIIDFKLHYATIIS